MRHWLAELWPIWAGLLGTLAIMAGCALAGDGEHGEMRRQKAAIDLLLDRGYTVIDPEGGVFDVPLE